MDLRTYTLDILGFGYYRVSTGRGTPLGNVEWFKGEFWLATACDGRRLGYYRRVRDACTALADDFHRSASALPHVVGDLLAPAEAASSQTT